MIWPSRAYVPGKSARHPEGAFDAIRASVLPDMSAASLSDSAAFRHGLLYIDHGYFWEAHEVLEPIWLALPEGSVERAFVQGLIQFANASLKLRMERPKAALRLCGIARDLLSPRTGVAAVMGVPSGRYLDRIDSLQREAISAI